MIKAKKSVQQTQPYSYPSPFKKAIKEFNIPKEDVLKLNYNEPTILPSPKVRIALKKFVEQEELQWYPEGGCNELREELAKYTKAKPENLIVGNGSDELLKAIAFTYLSEGDEVVVPFPNYSMFLLNAKLAGAKIVKVLCNDSLEFSVGELLENITEKTKAVYISNPNSPIGNAFSREEIVKILIQCKECAVVIDEAYFEFFGESVSDLVNLYENLIVVRTFSKAFSIASLRLGYAISSEKNIKELVKVRDPESVNSLAQIAGIEALKDLNHMKKFVFEIIKSKEFLSSELKKIGLEVFPSKANFVVVCFPKKFDAENIFKNLERKGIFLRNISKKPKLENCLRIGVPLLKESKKLVKEIKKELNPLLIFDIDGVLVDVSCSYREAIKNTVEFFTGFKVSSNDIQEYKNKGFYTNDWDLTEALILEKGMKIEKKKIIGKFQYFYLGDSNKKGLIDNEKFLLKKEILEKLGLDYELAIVTGRPREEAEYILKKYNSLRLFRTIIAMEDVKKGKPNPEGLNQILKKLNKKNAIYLGDTVDDMKAALSAGIKGIGVVPPYVLFEELAPLLEQNRAEFVLKDINKILEVKK